MRKDFLSFSCLFFACQLVFASPKAHISLGARGVAARSSVQVSSRVVQAYNAGYVASLNSTSIELFTGMPEAGGYVGVVTDLQLHQTPDRWDELRLGFLRDGVLPQYAERAPEVGGGYSWTYTDCVNHGVLSERVLRDPAVSGVVNPQDVEVFSALRKDDFTYFRGGCEVYAHGKLDFSQMYLGFLVSWTLNAGSSSDSRQDVRYSIDNFGFEYNTLETSNGPVDCHPSYVVRAYDAFGGDLLTAPVFKVKVRNKEKAAFTAGWNMGACLLSFFAGVQRFNISVDLKDDFRVAFPYAWASYTEDFVMRNGRNRFSVNPEKSLGFLGKLWGVTAGVGVTLPLKKGCSVEAGAQFSYVSEKPLPLKQGCLRTLGSPIGHESLALTDFRAADGMGTWHMTAVDAVDLTGEFSAKMFEIAFTLGINFEF